MCLSLSLFAVLGGFFHNLWPFFSVLFIFVCVSSFFFSFADDDDDDVRARFPRTCLPRKMSSFRRQCCVVGNRDMIWWWWFFFFSFVSLFSLSLSLVIVDTIQRGENSSRQRIHTHSRSLPLLPPPALLLLPREHLSLSLSLSLSCVFSSSDIACKACYLSLETECLFHRYTPEGHGHIERFIAVTAHRSSRAIGENRRRGLIHHSTDDAPILRRYLPSHALIFLSARSLSPLSFVTGLRYDVRRVCREKNNGWVSWRFATVRMIRDVLPVRQVNTVKREANCQPVRTRSAVTRARLVELSLSTSPLLSFGRATIICRPSK